MIEIRELRTDGLVTAGRLDLHKDGSVVIRDASPGLVEFLTEYRCVIPGSKPQRIVGIEDGEIWLEALPFNLRGTYLWAAAAPQRQPS